MKEIQPSSIIVWIETALKWADQHYSFISFHQDNGRTYPYGGFKNLLAIGNSQIPLDRSNPFNSLDKYKDQWLFGYFGYDLKNSIEDLSSKNTDHLAFEGSNFFCPEYLFEIQEDKVVLLKGDETVWSRVEQFSASTHKSSFGSFQSDFSKSDYIETVEKLISHIEEGDCYEINLCQGFHGEIKEIYPVDAYLTLNELSPKPFSCFQKFREHYILCASPERFLKKELNKLISQPIKGTRPRGKSQSEDIRLIEDLRTDKKEKAENLMIVDLVRNDLAKSSNSGSVKVEELFGIYSFQQVHQMISTVTSTLSADVTGIEALKNAFPMGSMTGAPKIKVMELIEDYEHTKRGAFSGASGYIEPNGNYDFNVLIRSLFLNTKKNIYGFHVGSAITYDAIPAKEYDECLLKAKAIFQLLTE